MNSDLTKLLIKRFTNFSFICFIEAQIQLVIEDKKIEEQQVSPTKNYEPMPLIKSGASIAADLRFGWRPVE